MRIAPSIPALLFLDCRLEIKFRHGAQKPENLPLSLPKGFKIYETHSTTCATPTGGELQGSI